MVQKSTKRDMKPRKTNEYDDIDYDDDNLLAMMQYERVIKNSNRIKVTDKKYNKRQNRTYDDDI